MLKRLLAVISLVLVTTPALATNAAFDSTAALARGRELRPFVSSGTPGPLWTAFEQHMRTAMGDSLRFARLMESIHGQVGAITEVVEEKMQQDKGWTYLARCRFENAPVPENRLPEEEPVFMGALAAMSYFNITILRVSVTEPANSRTK